MNESRISYEQEIGLDGVVRCSAYTFDIALVSTFKFYHHHPIPMIFIQISINFLTRYPNNNGTKLNESEIERGEPLKTKEVLEQEPTHIFDSHKEPVWEPICSISKREKHLFYDLCIWTAGNRGYAIVYV